MLFFELLFVANLLWFERIARQMRAEIKIRRSKAQRSPNHDLIENRGRRVDDQLAALRRLNNGPQIPRIHIGDGYCRFLPQKAPRPRGIAIPAPDHMSLTFQELREQRTCRARTQDKDSHGVSRLYHTRRKPQALGSSCFQALVFSRGAGAPRSRPSVLRSSSMSGQWIP